MTLDSKLLFFTRIIFFGSSLLLEFWGIITPYEIVVQSPFKGIKKSNFGFEYMVMHNDNVKKILVYVQKFSDIVSYYSCYILV